MVLTSPTIWESWIPLVLVLFSPLAVKLDIAGTIDLAILIGFTVIRNWSIGIQILRNVDFRPAFGIARGVGAAVLLIQGGKFWKYMGDEPAPKSKFEKSRPMLFPARTSHARIFPKTHAFSYSYLLVGIPVGWKGALGGMLAADPDLVQNSSRSWYSVKAEDYLDRGFGRLGLDGKLKKYLESQGIKHEDYPYAYLITAPRFLGYSFNPVSFWYLYSADTELTAMIVEVNNTFDERRMYFLRPSHDPEDLLDVSEEAETRVEGLEPKVDAAAALEAPGRQRKPAKFIQSWAKDFHVSPFNSRRGFYSMVAYDPLFPSMTGRGPINNTITYKSSKSHSKLVARIFSEGTALDPEEMTIWQKFVFMASWWWVGFVTLPRVVREAGNLFFLRRLHVWFRPEPLKESIGRQANGTEKQLEVSFRNYLRYLVETAPSALIVKYTAAGMTTDPEETMMSDRADEDPSRAKILELKVITPVFYARFVHYAHDLEAFFSEFNENGTIWLSQPSLLPELVIRRPQPPYETPSSVNYFFFKAIQKLRKLPLPIESSQGYVRKEETSSSTKSDIRNFRISAMDCFILAEGEPAEQKNYRDHVLKLFIVDRIAFGAVGLFNAEIYFFKCVLAWIVAGAFTTLFRGLVYGFSTV